MALLFSKFANQEPDAEHILPHLLCNAHIGSVLLLFVVVPSQPRDLTVNMLTDSSFLLSWKRPFYIGEKLSKYIVFYDTGSNKVEKELERGLENETVTIIVDKLPKQKTYKVKVLSKL